MEGRRHTTISDAGAIRIHDQSGEGEGSCALLVPNRFGDCTNFVQIGGNTPAGEHVPDVHPIEHIEIVVHQAGGWLSKHDCRNDYANPIAPARYRVHRSEGHAPAVCWLERTGKTSPRRAYAMVRSRAKGWSVALLAPFAGFTESQEDTLEIAAFTTQPRSRGIEIYTAGRHLYRLECPEHLDCAWWTLARLPDGTVAIEPRHQ